MECLSGVPRIERTGFLPSLYRWPTPRSQEIDSFTRDSSFWFALRTLLPTPAQASTPLSPILIANPVSVTIHHPAERILDHCLPGELLEHLIQFGGVTCGIIRLAVLQQLGPMFRHPIPVGSAHETAILVETAAHRHASRAAPHAVHVSMVGPNSVVVSHRNCEKISECTEISWEGKRGLNGSDGRNMIRGRWKIF